MKKAIYWLTALLIISISVIALSPQAKAANQCGDNLTYSLSGGGVLTIRGTGEMSESIYPNYSPFDNNKSITSVIVEEGVTTICTRAFYGCTNLTSISLPSTIKRIDGYAFVNTAYYNDEQNWENGVLYIGNYLIAASKDISGNYLIKDGTIAIAHCAFSNCTSLTGVTMPNSVKHIGESAFGGCTALSDLDISPNIESIYHSAFGKCSSLYNINLPDKVIDISSSAFNGTGFYKNGNNWTSGSMYSGEFYIGNHLINSDGHKGYLEVRKGTIDIARNAFEDCENTRIIAIPQSVKHIGAYQAYGCDKLKAVYFEGTEAQWKSIVAEPNEDLERYTVYFEKAHHHQLYTIEEVRVNATCTDDGGYLNITYCKECESEITRERVVFPALGHLINEWTLSKPATCLNSGEEAGTCIRKGCAYTEKRETPSLGHSFSDPITLSNPTCANDGAEVSVCMRCDEEKVSIIAATGHAYGSRWNYNNANHWVECTKCGDKTSFEPHISTGSNACTICSYSAVSNPEDVEPPFTKPNPPTEPSIPSETVVPTYPTEAPDSNTNTPTDPSDVTASTDSSSTEITPSPEAETPNKRPATGVVLTVAIITVGSTLVGTFLIILKRKRD